MDPGAGRYVAGSDMARPAYAAAPTRWRAEPGCAFLSVGGDRPLSAGERMFDETGGPVMGFDKLEVVRKLLAKAARAATPAEAASYTGLALRLSARHGIDAALVDAERRAARDPTADRPAAQRIPIDDPYSAGKARLLAWTAQALRCRVALHRARGGRVR